MIQGFVYDKNKNILPWVNIELKNENYQTIYKTRTNKKGFFKFNIKNDENFKYLIAVKNYATKYLEYWCTNLLSKNDIFLSIFIDKIEIYNLSYTIENENLIVSFRPMSLTKYLNNDADLCPCLNKKSIEFYIDDCLITDFELLEDFEIIKENNNKHKVFKLVIPNQNFKKITIKANDESNNLGMAEIFKC